MNQHEILDHVLDLIDKSSQHMTISSENKDIRNHILYIGLIGSHVYGTATENSDYDFYVIIDDVINKRYQIRDRELSYYDGDKSCISICTLFSGCNLNTDISIYPFTHIVNMLNEGHPTIFELVFLPSEYVIFTTHKITSLFGSINVCDPDVKKHIRNGFSKLCGINEVRARKKFLEGDIMIAIKTQYHYLRILLFALQIHKYHRIVDWAAGTDYLALLKADYANGLIMSEKYFRESTSKWIRNDTSKTYESGKTIATYFKECFPL